jgi:hypothetical protein
MFNYEQHYRKIVPARKRKLLGSNPSVSRRTLEIEHLRVGGIYVKPCG